MNALVEGGWIAPGDAGPDRRTLRRIALVLVACLLVWGVVLVLRTRTVGDDGNTTAVRIALAQDGDATVRGGGATVVRSERRRTSVAAWQVVEVRIPERGDRSRVDVRVELPGGVDVDTASLRVVAPGDSVRRSRGDEGPRVRIVERGAREAMRVLLVAPAGELEDRESEGRLDEVTTAFDRARVRSERASDRLDDSRSRWWLFVLVALAGVGVSVQAWRRSAKRWFSMRLPGPGADVVEPPSSTDPVGAAVLAAGAWPVDAPDAFAGQVLDLVERQQLQMRRTLDPALGAGAVLGLAHADEELATSEDPAVRVLRSIAIDEGLTVPLPDAAPKRLVAPSQERVDWAAHVAARERFERLVERAPMGRLRAVTAAFGVLTVVALGTALLGGEVGTRTLGLGVAAVLGPVLFALVAWVRDRARWRRVVQSRRHERAQWLAWITYLDAGRDAGPVRDHRLVPLVAAVGRGQRLASVSGLDAVGLAAATRQTTDALRTIVE